MLTLDLSKLGINEEQLTNAILNELGISREEAVRQIAAKLNVELPSEANTVVRNGSNVRTEHGTSFARILSQGDAETLVRAGEILSGLRA